MFELVGRHTRPARRSVDRAPARPLRSGSDRFLSAPRPPNGAPRSSADRDARERRGAEGARYDARARLRAPFSAASRPSVRSAAGVQIRTQGRIRRIRPARRGSVRVARNRIVSRPRRNVRLLGWRRKRRHGRVPGKCRRGLTRRQGGAARRRRCTRRGLSGGDADDSHRKQTHDSACTRHIDAISWLH